MAEVIRMPKMSDTMTEGVIAAWHKKVGDNVKSGDLLAEIETDKATMDFESPESGTLLYVGPKEKEAVAIDGILAIIGKSGEDFQSLLNGDKPKAETKENKPEENNKPSPAPEAEKKTEKPAEKVNATSILMPKMTDTMTEGTLVQWHKKVGDKIKSGDLLAEIETDKATMDFESTESGTLLYVGVEAGKTIAPGAVLAIVGEAGVDFKSLLEGGNKTESTSQPKAENKPEDENKTSEPQKEKESISDDTDAHDERIKISPLAKVLAKEKGITITEVKGTGENGRIVKKDIESFVPAAKPKEKEQPKTESKPAINVSAYSGTETFDEVSLSQMRKVIARRLSESLFTAPHFFLTMEINMDKAVTAREGMNEFSPVKISFNDIVIKAVAMALRRHPAVNSSWLGDKIRYNHHVSIGMAVAVEDGLLVPVIRFADGKSLSQISTEAKDLGGKAKIKKLQPQEMEGSTFSISNLGMFGIEEFTAIINPPNSCILAVGGIKQTPIVKNGEIKVGNIMKVTLSCDHRVVDGATGADFLKTLKGLLEEPMRLLI